MTAYTTHRAPTVTRKSAPAKTPTPALEIIGDGAFVLIDGVVPHALAEQFMALVNLYNHGAYKL